GVFTRASSERDEADYIPPGATWIKDAVTSFDPDNNAVNTQASGRVAYDYLVVAMGIQIDWHKIEGLAESLGKDGVCTNYSYDYVDSTAENIKGFEGGTAIFTMPLGPIKCAGAPQKIMW